MKIRSDFVTNSSSSSFVIAYKEPVFDEETLKRYPYIKFLTKTFELIFQSGGDGCCDETSPASIFNTQEEYDKYFLDRFSYCGKTIEDILKNEEDYVVEEYTEIKNFFEKGYKIMQKSVDYNDSTMYELIQNLADSAQNDFIILEDE